MSPRKHSSDRDWLAKHLRPLLEAGRKLSAFDESLPDRQPTYDPGYWSGLKLISLKYYIRPYLNILAPRTSVGYVDFFAGPGLDRLGRRRCPLPGSPLVPLMIRETRDDRFFKRIFLCERKAEYDGALRKRVSEYLPGFCDRTFHRGDANRFVRKLPELVDEHGIGHCLVFIDPEGMEWKWSSMVRLVENVDCDVIINFPSTGIQRNSTNRDPETRRTMARYLGIPLKSLPFPVGSDWAIRTYRENLQGVGKDISTEIRVSAKGAFRYHLIPAVRKTATGSQWFRIFLALKERIEKFDGDILGLIAQQLEGRQGFIDVN